MTYQGGRTVRGSGQRRRQRPAAASVGAGIALPLAPLAALAALALTCAGCSHILPLGPAPAAPRHLGSAVTLQLVLIQPPSPAGGCPAGSAAFSAPFVDYPQVPDACYRKTGKPVTITSAAVAMSYQPATNQQPAVYGLNLTVPAAEAPALAAITTRSFDSRDPVAISTAGKTWDVTMTAGPLSNGQFGMWVQSKNQILQLQRILIPPA
jgi:hypothetical protein